LAVLSEDMENIKANPKKASTAQGVPRDSIIKRQGPDAETVTKRTHDEAIAELREEMQMLQGKVEHAAIKAGYLAIAASECAHEEKACLYARLQVEEFALKSKLSSRTDSIAPGMPGGSPMMTGPGPDTGMGPLDVTLGAAPLEDRRGSFADDLLGGATSSSTVANAAASPLGTATGPAVMGGLSIAPSPMSQAVTASNDPFLTPQSMGAAMPAAPPTMLAPPSSPGGAASSAMQALAASPQAPYEFTINIDRSKSQDTPLGAAVDGSDNKTLVIEEVRAGLLQEWNNNNPTQVVEPGDRIVAVNGQRGHSRVLAEALIAPRLLVLTIYRPRGGSSGVAMPPY